MCVRSAKVSIVIKVDENKKQGLNVGGECRLNKNHQGSRANRVIVTT